jgi:hypothetical protein
MVPVQQCNDDYTIIRRAGGNTRPYGPGLIEKWSLAGPEIPAERSNRPNFDTYADAEREGRVKAEARQVSLWYEDGSGTTTLVASYRP